MNVISASDMRVPHHNLTPNTRHFTYFYEVINEGEWEMLETT